MENIYDIYDSPIAQKVNASKTMNRMNLHLENHAFISNVYWCRFSYNGYDSWNYEFHSHSFNEFHICVKGSAVFLLETGEKVEIKENDFVIFPAKTMHSLISVSEDFVKFVFGFDISIKESEEKNFLKGAFGASVPLRAHKASDEMRYAVASVLGQVLHRKPAYKLAVSSLLHFLIVEIAAELNQSGKTSVSYENEDIRLDRLIRFMKDNVNLNLDTEDFAREMNLSSKQLNRLMNETYGMTVSEYFRNERMKKIKDLLLTTELSLHDIARSLDFTDEYSMSKTFKNIAGITPGKYRKYYHK